MEKGRIIETGPHHELVERAGPYAALWASRHGGPSERPEAAAAPQLD